MGKFKALRRYLLGLAVTATGAAFANETMWPLALGASFSIMCTVPLVAALLKRRH